MKHILTGFIIAVFLTGSAFAAETIKGWGELRFGMTFEDVLKARPDIPWSNLDIETCREKNDPYISYCRIKTSWDSNFSINIADIPFRPWLDFNEENKLVRIRLISNEAYEQTPEAECEAAHKRVHENLAAQYGPSAGTAEEMNSQALYAYTTHMDAYKEYIALATAKAQERYNMRKEHEETGIAPRMRQYEPAMASQPIVALSGYAMPDICTIEITYAYGE